MSPSSVAPEKAARPSVRGALELVGLVIAPTTLLTALAFYFGWTLINARARYFGIDPSTLGFSTSDYVLRSVDALFVPIAVIVATGLALLTVHIVVARRLLAPRFRRIAVPVWWVAIVLGVALLVVGAVGMFRTLPDIHYLVAPLSGGVGATLVGYALFARGRLSLSAGALLASLVVLSAFWTASVYADALGRGRAKDLADSLVRQPRVVVYSTKRLHLPAQVEEARLEGRDSAYGFRYAGLRLLIRSGGTYFLLTERWTREDGVAILLRDSADVRLEFRPGE